MVYSDPVVGSRQQFMAQYEQSGPRVWSGWPHTRRCTCSIGEFPLTRGKLTLARGDFAQLRRGADVRRGGHVHGAVHVRH
eukprot:6564695-Pyramimonas_sp.AAC.1